MKIIIELLIQPDLWDCVGEDRNWSVAFVDLRPPEKRCHTGPYSF